MANISNGIWILREPKHGPDHFHCLHLRYSSNNYKKGFDAAINAVIFLMLQQPIGHVYKSLDVDDAYKKALFLAAHIKLAVLPKRPSSRHEKKNVWAQSCSDF